MTDGNEAMVTEESPIHRVTLVLAANGDRALEELAARHHWNYVEDVPRGHYVPRQRFWEAADETSIHDVADHRSGARFVILSGPNEAATANVRAQIEAAVSVRTESDLLQLLTSTDSPEELISAILILSSYRWCARSSSPSVDPRYGAVATRLAAHPNRYVRRALSMAEDTFNGRTRSSNAE